MPTVHGISIHAPSQGATITELGYMDSLQNFNPRSPHRERLPLLLLLDMFQLFQSTLPSQGATVDSLGNVFSEIISIHALLTGSDPIRYPVGTNQGNFNPRSPHRERPSCGNRWGAGANFNPRSPHRERRFKVNLANTVRNFNPRSPHRERR